MNEHAIDQARDRALRLSEVALQRAAQGAHALATTTGRTIIVSRDSLIEHLSPEAGKATPPRQLSGAVAES